MSKEKKRGILARFISNMNEDNLAKTRNRMLIATKISIAIKNKGLSQKQFAAQMGKTESEISDWLSGERNFIPLLLSFLQPTA